MLVACSVNTPIHTCITAGSICFHLCMSSVDWAWNIFSFPEMLPTLKSQKMPNYTNTWSRHTGTITDLESVNLENTQAQNRQPKDGESGKFPAETSPPGNKPLKNSSKTGTHILRLFMVRPVALFRKIRVVHCPALSELWLLNGSTVVWEKLFFVWNTWRFSSAHPYQLMICFHNIREKELVNFQGKKENNWKSDRIGSISQHLLVPRIHFQQKSNYSQYGRVRVPHSADQDHIDLLLLWNGCSSLLQSERFHTKSSENEFHAGSFTVQNDHLVFHKSWFQEKAAPNRILSLQLTIHFWATWLSGIRTAIPFPISNSCM